MRRCRRRCCWQDVPPHIIHYEQVPFRIRPDGLRQLCCYRYVSSLYFSILVRGNLHHASKDGSKGWNILSIFRRWSYENPQTKGSCYSTASSTDLFVRPTGSTKPAAGSTRGYRRTISTLRAMDCPWLRMSQLFRHSGPRPLPLLFHPHNSPAT